MAQHSCRQQFNGQGRLFEPRNEANYLSIFASENMPQTEQFWIGVTKSPQDVEFHYATGGSLSFNPIRLWGYLQPSNGWVENLPVEPYERHHNRNNENCVATDPELHDSPSYSWNDSPCSDFKKSLCEKSN